MPSNINIGHAFPLEKLGSEIARNEYNYQSILNGLIAWNNTTEDEVIIRLTKDTDPWYEDYIIPSKKSVFDTSTFKCNTEGSIGAGLFAVDCKLESALSGGSRVIETATFDSTSDVNTSNEQITLSDGTSFSAGDRVKFTGTLPTGINTTTDYYIKDKVSTNVITVSETYNGPVVDLTATAVGTGTIYQGDTDSGEPAISSDDPSDLVTFRLSVNNKGNSSWGLYYSPTIQTWTSGEDYKYNQYVTNTAGDVLYRVISDVENSTTVPDVDSANFEPVIKNVWTSGNRYNVGEFVEYNSKIYQAIATVASSTIIPSEDEDNFEFYANIWTSGTNYVAGDYVYYGDNFFLATEAITNSTSLPLTDSDKWDSVFLRKVPTSSNFTQSVVFRWQLNTDVAKFILRNESDSPSTSLTDITLKISARYKEPSSIYQRSVDLFSTSNYAYYPDNERAIWDTTTIYGPTDTSRSIENRQDYSAVMIFDHARPDTSKTVNFINYDGPDLDQGLCIYLPVEVDVGEDGIAYPEDGFTYEFFFRIWPNASLTDSTTRDHIVNKSQIYVYSSLNRENITDDNCGTPIAKFSMARTTNFYMFGENVAIPDKPVCYRATFVYSESQKKWCTLDYYQLPDHVFVGPVGFIDPQSPANLDINNEVIGNINPNASNIGYETAGFPLFQDPFSNPDLTPYRITGDDDLDVFKNRII